jgi:hypothetical protein
MAKKVMIVAGEVSGDQHAARLVRDLRAVRGDVEFFGIGGDAMRREGVRTVVDARDMAVVGFFEVLARYPFFRRVFNQHGRAAGAREARRAVAGGLSGLQSAAGGEGARAGHSGATTTSARRSGRGTRAGFRRWRRSSTC